MRALTMGIEKTTECVIITVHKRLFCTCITMFLVTDSAESFNTILAASTGGSCLSQVSEDDVILAMSYFRCQAKGEDGIKQIVVTRALPIISPYLTRILNASLS